MANVWQTGVPEQYRWVYAADLIALSRRHQQRNPVALCVGVLDLEHIPIWARCAPPTGQPSVRPIASPRGPN